jgi:hypothetical protein
LGDKKLSQNVQRYTTEKNKLINSDYVVSFEKELQKQLDEIKTDDSLSGDEKLDKARNLITQNFDKASFVPNSKGGKFNITANSWVNALSDVAAEIAPQIGIALVTGGAGNVSKLREVSSLFGSTFATAYNDYYTEAIDKNIPNPTTYAITHTTIEAASELLNNDLQVAKRMVNPKSTLGKILDNVTPEQWNAMSRGKFANVAKALTETGKKAGKNAFKDTAEELSGQLASNVADNKLFGEDVGVFDGVKSTIVNTFLGTLPLGLLGGVGQIKNINRSQAYALYEAAQNKEKYFPLLDKAVENEEISKTKAEAIRDNIEKAASSIEEIAKTKNGEPLTDNEKVDAMAEKLGITVIRPEEIKKPETTVIESKEYVPEEKAGVSVILPQTNTKPNIIEPKTAEADKKSIIQEAIDKGEIKGMYADFAKTALEDPAATDSNGRR